MMTDVRSHKAGNKRIDSGGVAEDRMMGNMGREREWERAWQTCMVLGMLPTWPLPVPVPAMRHHGVSLSVIIHAVTTASWLCTEPHIQQRKEGWLLQWSFVLPWMVTYNGNTIGTKKTQTNGKKDLFASLLESNSLDFNQEKLTDWRV